MIVELQQFENRDTRPDNQNTKNRRTLLNFRYYLDNRFGHGFWHSLMNSEQIIRAMYFHEPTRNDEMVHDIIYLVAQRVNLSKTYIEEDFNLFLFKNDL
ncbi:MAG: hypothetical protein ACW99A_07655 [Candidatus Kariarchaeaceae archaeon]|jgi:hypothetical protein